MDYNTPRDEEQEWIPFLLKNHLCPGQIARDAPGEAFQRTLILYARCDPSCHRQKNVEERKMVKDLPSLSACATMAKPCF